MNKKLLAVAIASALAAPLAMADAGNITIYGSANASIDSVDAGATLDTTEISNNQSVFGVKGFEDLGNGLKAVFLFDVFVDPTDGQSEVDVATTSGFFGGARDSWVGLEGNFGTVALGAQGRPWKTATNNTDVFVNTIADYSSIVGTSSGTSGAATLTHDTGIGNSIIWFGPDINGFSFHAQYGFDETDTAIDQDQFGAQINYTNGGWRATYAYDNQENQAGTANTDVKANKASLSYTFGGATTISAIYDDVSTDVAASSLERDAWWLGLSHNIGNNTFKLAYANADDSDVVGGNDGADFWAVGLSHNISKRTELYGLYAKTDNDRAARYGLGHPNAASSQVRPIVNGQDVDAISVGIKHNF